MNEHLWLIRDDDEVSTTQERKWYFRPISRWAAMGGIVGLALLASVIGVTTKQDAPEPRSTSVAHHTETASSVNNTHVASTGIRQSRDRIEVDVHGDVRDPGVVSLQSGARVADAIRAAGGFLHKQDADDINEASVLWDGQEVDVPAPAMPSANAAGDSFATNPENTTTAPLASASQKIDINTADAAALETLPGVGPKRAAEILAYRQTQGAFTSLEQLGDIRGIGPKTLEKWSGLLLFAQPTESASHSSQNGSLHQ